MADQFDEWGDSFASFMTKLVVWAIFGLAIVAVMLLVWTLRSAVRNPGTALVMLGIAGAATAAYAVAAS